LTVAEERRVPAAQKDFRGQARSFRYSCSKNEHDFREAIKRTLDDAQNLPYVSQGTSGLSLWVFFSNLFATLRFCNRFYEVRSSRFRSRVTGLPGSLDSHLSRLILSLCQ
jgi:hypothetical protein